MQGSEYGPGGQATSGAGGSRAFGQRRRAGRTDTDMATDSSIQRASLFPPAQRLFVLVLEAADSHRLNSHLAAYTPSHTVMLSNSFLKYSSHSVESCRKENQCSGRQD
jgi:hypothetical protein